MMFIPRLRREMRVLALLLIVYFMSFTWTGKAQYILYVYPLQCEPFLASFRVVLMSVFEIGRFTKKVLLLPSSKLVHRFFGKVARKIVRQNKNQKLYKAT